MFIHILKAFLRIVNQKMNIRVRKPVSVNDLMQTAPQTGRFCEAKRTRSGASGHLNLMI